MSEKFYEDRAMRAGPEAAPSFAPKAEAKPATYRMKRASESSARFAGRRVRPGDDVSDIYATLAPEEQAQCEPYTPHCPPAPEAPKRIKLERVTDPAVIEAAMKKGKG